MIGVFKAIIYIMEIKDELMINVLRNGAIESQHLGSFVAVDFNGRILAKVGDPNRKTYNRSSAKPLQAIPTFADDECMRRFRFTSRERALMTGSHNAERRHQKIGAEILEKLGLEIKHLHCGIHPPIDKDTQRDMRRKGEPFTPLCHNCAGNHLVMLALSVHRGWPIDDYTNPEHPYQQEVLKWVSLLSGEPKKKIKVGSDGCTAPVYHQTLLQFAMSFARFSIPEKLTSLPNPDNLDLAAGARAMRMIMHDYWAHPEIMSGRTRFNAWLHKIGKGRIFTKGGGEGFQVAGLADEGVGFSIKILDGDPLGRAKSTAMIEAMHQIGLISDEIYEKARRDRKFFNPFVPNQRGTFDLEFLPDFKVKILSGWKEKYG